MSATQDPAEENLLIERLDGVAVLTLNRPEVLNALDTGLMRALRQAVEDLANDDGVRCVVVTGAGKGFCAGGDRNAINAAFDQRSEAKPEQQAQQPRAADEVERRAAWIRRSAEASRLLHEMPKPTIAVVNGACAGAGLSIAAACDLRFCAQSAKFVTGFAPMGIPGDYGGAWFLTRILGTTKARELFFLSERLDADKALDWGLVDRVYPDAELREKTLEIAARLAAMPGRGLAFAKANLNAACDEPLDAFLDRESRNMVLAREALVAARRAAKDRDS